MFYHNFSIYLNTSEFNSSGDGAYILMEADTKFTVTSECTYPLHFHYYNRVITLANFSQLEGVLNTMREYLKLNIFITTLSLNFTQPRTNCKEVDYGQIILLVGV